MTVSLNSEQLSGLLTSDKGLQGLVATVLNQVLEAQVSDQIGAWADTSIAAPADRVRQRSMRNGKGLTRYNGDEENRRGAASFNPEFPPGFPDGFLSACRMHLTALQCGLDKQGVAPHRTRAACSVHNASMRTQRVHGFVMPVARSWN